MNWVDYINKAHGIVKNAKNTMVIVNVDDDIIAVNIYGLNTSHEYFLNRLTPMT